MVLRYQYLTFFRSLVNLTWNGDLTWGNSQMFKSAITLKQNKLSLPAGNSIGRRLEYVKFRLTTLNSVK